jgi:hypothetical protein
VLRCPRKIATFEAESTVLEVTTPHTDGVNALCSEFRVGGLATELELSLFAVVRALSTSRGALVS